MSRLPNCNPVRAIQRIVARNFIRSRVSVQSQLNIRTGYALGGRVYDSRRSQGITQCLQRHAYLLICIVFVSDRNEIIVILVERKINLFVRVLRPIGCIQSKAYPICRKTSKKTIRRIVYQWIAKIVSTAIPNVTPNNRNKYRTRMCCLVVGYIGRCRSIRALGVTRSSKRSLCNEIPTSGNNCRSIGVTKRIGVCCKSSCCTYKCGKPDKNEKQSSL